MLLKTDALSIKFGGLTALDDLNLKIHSGELVGLIGPNGAGKTTVFNLLTGVYSPSGGNIFLSGKSLKGLKPFQVTQSGIARTFQNIRLFSELSVLDNVKIAHNYHLSCSLAESVLRAGRYFPEEEDVERESAKLLEIFNLKDKMHETAKNLPYGEQRRLEIARALATRPSLLLLDEPAAGMNPQETNDLTKMIRWIRGEFALTVLLIEHDMRLVMDLCERIYVLEYGITIAQGAPEKIRRDPRVIEAYLGEEVPDAPH
ncbi:MAG: ABC transporter ATP-binding protein [Acidaminococcales bacterium]|jgi:branched-chain amino acid transport system ATP-binding protein|nr:ABC transporter ATP-binding protein [Acidaminococcales bacterium]